MKLVPQPVPRIRLDTFEKQEALRRRMWVCLVPDCHRVQVAPALPRAARLCSECGKQLPNGNLTEQARCRPCRRLKENR
jgi:hypothetical protein